MADRKIFGNQGPTKPDLPSSVFDLSHACNMTARLGKLYPCLLYEVPAKSTVEIEPRCGFDLHPLNFPIQSNVRCHIKVFKAPMRILWKNYEDWYGQHGDHVMPYIKRNYYWHGQGSLADYMGVPSSALLVNGQMIDVQADNFFSGYTLGQNTVLQHYVDGQLTADGNSYGFHIRMRYLMVTESPIFYLDLLTAEPFDPSVYSANRIHLNTPSMAGTVVDSMSYSAAGGVGHWSSPSAKRNQEVYVSNTLCYRTQILIEPSSTFVAHLNTVISRNGFTDCFFIWTVQLFGTPLSGIIYDSSQSSYFEPNSDPEKPGQGVVLKVVSHLGFSFNVTYRGSYAYNDDGANSHFVVQDGDTEPRLPINALPFRMYETIYNYFFNNERVTPFLIDGHETYNKFFTNDDDGGDETTPLELKNVPFEYDIFTTCVKTPQFGNAPLVGITTNDEDASAIMHMVPDQGDEYDIGVNLDGDANIIGISNYEDVADKPSVMRLQEAIKFGISINDLRNVSALQRFQERYLKAGNKYANIVYEFYGTNPPVGDHYPEYLGGITEDVIVDKITNVAKSEGNELGEFAGQASFRMKSNHKIKCFCSEASYIMAVCYFTVTPSYPQMLPKLFMRSNLLDYYNPQFANIGPQPIMKNQLCPLQLDASHLYDVFGYNAPWVDYKMMLDEVHGDFRGSMANFLIQRRFAEPPSLNDRFINIHSEDLTDVFSVLLDTDKIFGQIWFDMKAKLPMPRYSIPRIV